MSTRNAEKLRRLVAAHLGVPWRSVSVVLRTAAYRKRRARILNVDVVTGGGRIVNTGAFGSRRRWLVARAVAYAEAGAETWAECDAYDAAHPPLYGRVGRWS